VPLAEALQKLTEVSLAISSERDHEALLGLILTKARELSTCDAGSLYLVDAEQSILRFVQAQNSSVELPFRSAQLPLDDRSLAGYVALTGQVLNLEDAYRLPEGAPYRINRSFDQQTGYVTRSVLVLPMRNHRGDVIGVLQLINRKREAGDRIHGCRDADNTVIGFDPPVVELMKAFASLAAVAIDNNNLIHSIRNLFEGFVKASVTAIEQRDPTTSGHSSRVSILTVGIAELVDRSDAPLFRDISFSREQMRELRYASILHDFGKVGVREQVLVKAKKLYEGDLERVITRLELARLLKEREVLRHKVRLWEAGVRGEDARLGDLDRQLEEYLRRLESYREVILRSNEPTVLPEGEFSVLQEIAGSTFTDQGGEDLPLLLPEEARVLSIRKGSLTEEERQQVESHVTHTYHFLNEIPWTPELKGVPTLAFGHHEKLNGHGYPRGVAAPEIPIQTRMMTVADIFDALSAADRPYKRAVTIEKTLDILQMEAKDGMLDRTLVDLFIQGRVYEQTLHLRQAR
jgi:HD-GYP domain-containing protein (c-di-GMP phosphodiesterase class II)